MTSDSQNQSLWIYTADCIPILFADIKTGKVAATHAGWKGLTRNIIKNTIRCLLFYGSKKDNLIVALGPCISAKNYEVGSEVIAEVAGSLINKQTFYPSNEDNYIESMRNLKIIQKGVSLDKHLLEIRLLAYYQLLQEGLKSENISINNMCTYEEDSLFNSWRRDKVKSSQWSFIVSKGA